jgi:hypothetical protein
MVTISAADVAVLVGPTSDFVRSEILKVGAPREELRLAVAFVASEAGREQKTYQTMSARMQRLVDLVTVTNARSMSNAIVAGVVMAHAAQRHMMQQAEQSAA